MHGHVNAKYVLAKRTDWCKTKAFLETARSRTDPHLSDPCTFHCLTPNMLAWKIWRFPNNVGRWQMVFNSVSKG